MVYLVVVVVVVAEVVEAFTFHSAPSAAWPRRIGGSGDPARRACARGSGVPLPNAESHLSTPASTNAARVA